MILFNSFYRMQKDGRTVVMPAPVDPDTPDAKWHTDVVAGMASELAKVGFTAVLWPPLTKAQGGCADDADGYGLLDPYDLGSKDQAYSVPTRWGTAEQLRRAIAVVRRNGMQNLADLVIHQYDGGRDGIYRYPSATGKDNGRFPKDPPCFVGAPPRVPADPVFDSDGNYAFGDMCSYVNSTPKNYMRDGMVAAAVWQQWTLGLDGFRIDDTKGENIAVTNYLRSKLEGFCFGECFDGNPSELERWVRDTNGSTATLDFTLHFALRAFCMGGSARLLDGAGLIAWDPGHAVTFVDTADTDRNDSENIPFNKLLAYAYILTATGTPEVYAGDYLPSRYGLKPWIDNLVWINRTFAFGAMETRYVDDDHVICFSRDGNGGEFGWSGGLITAISSDPLNDRTITVQTPFGAYAHCHDYTGHSDDAWTDQYGRLTFTIPSNYFGGGQSYVCYARAGVSNQIQVKPQTTTQFFYGTDDLDIAPLVKGWQTLPSRVWIGGKTTFALSLSVPPVSSESGIATVVLLDPTGVPVRSAVVDSFGKVTISGITIVAGWYKLRLLNTSTQPSMPFELAITYKATETI